MKTKDAALKYGIHKKSFEAFLRKTHIGTDGLMGMTIPDDGVEETVGKFKAYLLEENAKAQRQADVLAQAAAAEAEERAHKQKCLSEMLITSGFNFDGYTIKKYSGYISGDDCVTIPRDNFFGTSKVENNLCSALVKIRRQAIKELKEAAYNLGCNAVIGVDFDYMTMDPQHGGTFNAGITVYEPYVICVTANGNAVVIEKNE